MLKSFQYERTKKKQVKEQKKMNQIENQKLQNSHARLCEKDGYFDLRLLNVFSILEGILPHIRFSIPIYNGRTVQTVLHSIHNPIVLFNYSKMNSLNSKHKKKNYSSNDFNKKNI